MNSEEYCNNIKKLLAWLIAEVRMDAASNLHSINIHAEEFFRAFLNVLFGWELTNANAAGLNAEGIDLHYPGGNVVVQVSSTTTHEKIQASLEKTANYRKTHQSSCQDAHFYFVAIDDHLPKYRDPFEVPEGLIFDPKADILDTTRLHEQVVHCTDRNGKQAIDIQRELSNLVDKYFEPQEPKNLKLISKNIKSPLGISSVSLESKSESKPLFSSKQVWENEDAALAREELLFAVYSKMSYEINQSYLAGIHCVRCTPYFQKRGHRYKLVRKFSDLLDPLICNKSNNTIRQEKQRIMQCAEEFAKHHHKEIDFKAIEERLEKAPLENYFPVVYVIPISKIENCQTRCKRDNTMKDVYEIDDLRTSEFSLIDLSDIIDIIPINFDKGVDEQ